MPTDTPALLPPDPTMKAYYWLRAGTKSPGPWLWIPDTRSWFSRNQAGSVVRYAEGMASEGYTLASPHPIPGPATLEALHYAIKLIRDRAAAERAADEGVDFFRGFACGMEHATGLLRQALETKETT